MSKTYNIKRFGNVIELKADKLEEYKALHSDSHPGVRHLLTKYNIKNYSIFMFITVKDMNKEIKNESIEITEMGSLGLLAIGDIGLRAWRKVKNEARQKRKDEEKE